MSIQAFTIDIAQSTLDDLRERLARTRWPDEVEGAGWDYGTNLGYLKELVDYWQHTFDWRVQEAKLNRFAQFRAQIDGIHIHFVHERARRRSGIPLILTHGWPSTFIELLPLVPLLTDPRAHGIDGPAFDVVIPSLPGYGWSSRPNRRGVTTHYTAGLWHRLMRRLGYERYGAQGGDFGAPALHRPWVATALRSRARVLDAVSTLGRGGWRLQSDSIHQASDALLRVERLAGWFGRLDRGEVPRVE